MSNYQRVYPTSIPLDVLRFHRLDLLSDPQLVQNEPEGRRMAEQLAEVKEVLAPETMETYGNIWKHMETYGNIWKHGRLKLISLAIWAEDFGTLQVFDGC